MLISQPAGIVPENFIQDANPSVCLYVPSLASTPSRNGPLQVQIPLETETMRDICAVDQVDKVDIQTLIPGDTNKSFKCETYSLQSSVTSADTWDKLVPRKKDDLAICLDSDISTSVSSHNTVVIMEDFSAPLVNPIVDISVSSSSIGDGYLGQYDNSIPAIQEPIQTPIRNAASQSIISSKARLSTKKSTKSTVTHIKLPSGKSLRISYDETGSTIKDLKR